MVEHKLPFFSQVLKGRDTDFSDKWYKDTGATIVRAMIIASLFPIIEVCMFGTYRWVKRMLDRKCGSDMFVSRKRSIQQYVDIQVGPDFLIHFRFAGQLNMVFVCLMYGTGIPLLFPISLFAFTLLYFVERFCVFYYYKQPPMLGDELTLNTIRILNWAPIVYMFSGYWMLGNKQIFANVLFPITFLTDV